MNKRSHLSRAHILLISGLVITSLGGVLAPRLGWSHAPYASGTYATSRATHGMATVWQLNVANLPSAAEWFTFENPIAVSHIQAAITQPNAAPGVVIASPSTVSPNYYYHWIRDGALTMDVVVSLLQSGSTADNWTQRIENYAAFSRSNQTAQTLTGLGEPKFLVNGTPFSGPWGRPQNDGPALRAITFMHWAQLLLVTGNESYVRSVLFDSQAPSQSLIKTDLDYVAANWQNPSYDLWEEVEGDHFFTRMVQRKALALGAQLAQQLGDSTDASVYQTQANAIASDLGNFWMGSVGYIGETRNYRGGLNSKGSNLDIAVVLGSIHGALGDGLFDMSDARVRSSINALINAFNSKYAINHVQGFPAVATGRYPEDIYDGANFQGGNPWVLSTLAIAQCFYETATIAKANPSLGINPAQLIAQGDLYVQRVALHANPDGSLSEQIDRNSGYMTSANNLTWNYASVLRTYWAREQAIGN